MNKKQRSPSEDQWYLSNEDDSTTTRFQKLQSQITQIGLEHHRETILENSARNAQFIRQTIRDVSPDPRPCLVISAGPSLHRQGILKRIRGFKGTIVAADGAYIHCLKNGIKPDWVVTIDPSPRIVRWFGKRVDDEYFKRQDLDISIREEEENEALIDANKTRLAICTTAPQNVVERTQDWDRYWFAPLVDNPEQRESITRLLGFYAPAINTGGTVGTCGFVFGSYVLHARDIAVVGMDFGYPRGTKLEQTQEWNMLKNEPNVHDLYPWMNGHWGAGFTSPTYYWYMQNFLDLLNANDMHVTNCSGEGLLRGDNVTCCEIEEWMTSHS